MLPWSPPLAVLGPGWLWAGEVLCPLGLPCLSHICPNLVISAPSGSGRENQGQAPPPQVPLEIQRQARGKGHGAKFRDTCFPLSQGSIFHMVQLRFSVFPPLFRKFNSWVEKSQQRRGKLGVGSSGRVCPRWGVLGGPLHPGPVGDAACPPLFGLRVHAC